MDSSPNQYRSPRWFRAGFVLAGLASFSGFVFMVAHAIATVNRGRGLETYRTFWLVEDNWIGFLIFAGAAIVALVLGLLFRWREHQQWREFEAKYGGRGDGTSQETRSK